MIYVIKICKKIHNYKKLILFIIVKKKKKYG